MKAKTIRGNSTEEINIGIEESLADGYQPTLALVFMSKKQDIQTICNILDRRKIAIYGTTTNGEITDSEISAGGISILLLDLDPNSFKVLFEEYKEINPVDASRKMATQALECYSDPVFLIACSDFMINYQSLLKGFKDVAGDKINVFGGVAGDDVTDTEQLVFTNKTSSNKGMVSVAFNGDKVIVRGQVVCGWNPVGTVKTVTRSEGNRIYEIDGESALDITLRYAGIKEIPENNNELIILLSRTLAMQFQRDKGDPVTLIGIIEEDGSMIVHQDIPVGAQLRYALPPDFEVVDEVAASLGKLKSAIPDPDALLVYSCSARIDVLGPIIDEEITAIYKLWNKPMAGFFCNGELARANNGDLEIHNLTAACVVLKEHSESGEI